MNLSKLPPHLLMTLGLSSCVVEACLSPDPTEIAGTTGPSDDITTGTGRDTTSTGPCLGAPMDSTGTDTGTGTGSDTGTGGDATSVGPCLGVQMDSTRADSDTSRGGMLDEPPLPNTRAAAVERVLSRGTLPADVLERLRALTGPSKG